MRNVIHTPDGGEGMLTLKTLPVVTESGQNSFALLGLAENRLIWTQREVCL